MASDVRLLMLALWVSLAPLAMAAPPANDDCASAEEVLVDSPLSGSTMEATGTGTGGCSSEDYFDVWHFFSAPADGFYTFSSCGSDFDTTLAVYDSCGGALLACNEDSFICATAAAVECLEMTSGQTVYLRVAGYLQMRGNYSLSVSSCASPDNDLCANAVPIDPDVQVSGSNLGATNSGDLSPCSTNDLSDVWYSYTPEVNETVSVSLCGSDFDTTLTVYDACGGNVVACNEDGLVCSGNGYASFLSDLNLMASQTYLFRVAGWEARTGRFKIAVGTNEPPVVQSIVRAETGPTAHQNVFFFVYFDREVIGFDSIDDLNIIANGVSYSGVEITRSDDAWDVQILNLEGQGDIAIAVRTDSDVRSAVNVPLASSLTSDPIQIDRVSPTISELRVSPAVARPGDIVTIEVATDVEPAYVEVFVNGEPASRAKTWLETFTYQMSEADSEGPVLVEAYVEDELGNGFSFTDGTQLIFEALPELPLATWPALGLLPLSALWTLRRRKG